MVSNKMSFMPEFLIHFIKYNTYGKEDLIKIENSKKSTKSSTKHCNPKQFCSYKIFFQIFFFSSQICCKAVLQKKSISMLPVFLLK